MANEYQKINTLFLRDEHNIIIPDRFTCSEFIYLSGCSWECTEKIDGTNIHIDITYSSHMDENQTVHIDRDIQICGRTAKASIPEHLRKRLEEIVAGADLNEIFHPVLEDSATNCSTETISIYGEGFGAKIQKGGNYIKDGVDFILFDVKVGNWWLSREDCEKGAEALHVSIVPIIGYFTIPEAIEYVKKGFKSTIAQNPDYDAEGLVLKTPFGLKFRNGQRIITKIKTCDFQKYRNKYGDGPVNQQPNPHYNK